MKKCNNIWDEYIKIEEIGSNFFSKVYKAKNNLTDNYVAIKEIKKTNINENTILKVIETMKKLKNSILLLNSIETNEYYYLIYELCFLSLEKYLNIRENPLSINEIKEMLLELNKCFKEMKEKNIIHGNLKPSNILLSLNKTNINKMDFKISDFGINELRDIKKINLDNIQITMSPEIIKGEKNMISSKSDIWSLGIIIYYMLFKQLPYINNKDDIQEIENNEKLKLIYDLKLKDLINKMLIININKRISWEDYFKHPFFNQNSNENIELKNKITSFTAQKIIQIDFNESVNYLMQINKNYFIASIGKGIIKIFDNFFKIILTIQLEKKHFINYILQIKDGRIVTCSNNIKIIKLLDNYTRYEITQEFFDNQELICKVIELSTSHLVSLDYNGTVNFYMKSNDGSGEYFLFKINKNVFGTVSNAFEIPNKKFIISSGNKINFKIKLYDAQTCDYIKTLDKFDVMTYFAAKEIYLLLSPNILAIGTYCSISIIDLEKEILIKRYPVSTECNWYTYVITKFKNNYILCGIDGDIVLFLINDDWSLKYIGIIKNAHEIEVNSIIALDEKSFLSSGKEGKIIKWELI